MKKLILAAVLFVAVDASAQDRRMDDRGRRGDRPEFFHKKDDFGGRKLTLQQKREIDRLSKMRLSPREYDARVREILSRDRFAGHMKPQPRDPRMEMPTPYRR